MDLHEHTGIYYRCKRWSALITNSSFRGLFFGPGQYTYSSFSRPFCTSGNLEIVVDYDRHAFLEDKRITRRHPAILMPYFVSVEPASQFNINDILLGIMCPDAMSREIIFRFMLRYGVEKPLKPASQDLVFE